MSICAKGDNNCRTCYDILILYSNGGFYMNFDNTIILFENAREYCEENYMHEIEWVQSITPSTLKNMKAKRFLESYCWVVYASGFKASTVENKFPNLKKAFKDFDLEKLYRMRSLSSALKAFNNDKKASSFLKGAKLIADEGFSKFKKRIQTDGIDSLEELPGIGPITKYHLAKEIGLADVAKPDVWLVRASILCETTVDELVSFLSNKYNLENKIVDVILWRYGANIGYGIISQ